MNTDSDSYSGQFTGEISQKGMLVLDEPGRWAGWLMRHARRRVTVTLTREKLRRSDSQNRRYWALIVPCFSEWSGYEKDECHELLLRKFASYEDALPSGEVVERVQRSSKMSIEEFNEFTSRVERFLAEHGFEFPDDKPAPVSEAVTA